MVGTEPELASETAYREVKAAILDGEFGPGTMLSEGKVAERLAVSRTPVREAFGRLQAEGWLRIYPKRGALVVEAGPTERKDVLDARLLFEGYGVQQAIRAGSHEELATRLDKELTAQQAALDSGDHSRLVLADVDFHFLVMAACGNQLLIELSLSIRDRLERMAAKSFWRRAENAQHAIDDHSALLEAVRAGEAERYIELLGPHMTRIHEELLG